jgi:hypothetical protein
MDLTQLLRRSATMPLHAAAEAASTGFALATMPVRGVTALVSGPCRDSIAGSGRGRTRRGTAGSAMLAWPRPGLDRGAVRGLHDPTHGPLLAERVLSALRAQPDVASAELNYPLSRVVVSLSDADTLVGELCDLVFSAQRPLTRHWRSPPPRSTRPHRRGRHWPSTCCCTLPKRPSREQSNEFGLNANRR